MRTKKFNIICTVVAILGWLMYLASTVHSAVFAVLFPVAAVGLGLVGEVFIKGKKAKENPDLVAKIKAKDIAHYILTFLALVVIFYAFGTFANPAYGYHSFGSGKYGYEISFWEVGEIIPDLAFHLEHNILPLALIVFAVYCKPIAFAAAGLLSWVSVMVVNTSKVFGEYTIVSASGNESGRETIVYTFANEVVKAVCILCVAMFVLALIDLIVRRSKKAVMICVMIVALCVGIFSMYMGYSAYTSAKTYDIEKHRDDIYTTTKEGSEKFQAENFHNSYGDMSTECAYPGCERLIVTSGDSNCCAAHSNRCGECKKYIDGDAMFCMDCIKDALD